MCRSKFTYSITSSAIASSDGGTTRSSMRGGDCRLVDKYEVGRIKKALLPNPASARAGDVGALPLCRPQTFF